MKYIKIKVAGSEQVRRITDEMADKLVTSGKAVYEGKEEWVDDILSFLNQITEGRKLQTKKATGRGRG